MPDIVYNEMVNLPDSATNMAVAVRSVNRSSTTIWDYDHMPDDQRWPTPNGDSGIAWGV